MKPNRPVDMSDEFKENGWEYCKYLITDPRSDTYLRRMEEKNASTQLETPLQEGAKTNA